MSVVDRKRPSIEHECLWPNGARFRKRSWPASTSAGTTILVGYARKSDPERFAGEPTHFRVYVDGALVREFDYVAQRYTLCLEFPPGHEMRVPSRDPVRR